MSDKELKKAHWLFSLMSNPYLVKVGSALTLVSLKLRLPVKSLIRATVYDHFCGGETIEDCMPTVRRMEKYGLQATLDYSVERENKEEDFERTLEAILHTLDYAAEYDGVSLAVFKPTGLVRFELLKKIQAGEPLTDEEKEEFARLEARLDRICRSAAEKKMPVMADAEESWIQDPMDELMMKMMSRYNRDIPYVYNTLQMYRKDRFDHLKEAHKRGRAEGFTLGFKLVRGAYMEKERARAQRKGYPSPIHETKEDVDRDYDDAVRYVVDNIDEIALVAGTHNEQSSLLLTQLISEKGLSVSDPRIYFSQLYGMSDHISYNLADAGYNVVKYLPFGPVREVMPYLIRRVEENTSVSGQTGRELSLLKAEMERRRLGQPQ